MKTEQIERLEAALLKAAEKLAETATTAAEVEALAAVALALVEVHEI